VSVQPQDIVDIRHVPRLERTPERQLGDRWMIGGMSDLDTHCTILSASGADRTNHKFLQGVLKPNPISVDIRLWEWSQLPPKST
jgi:hypothetical protein